MQYLYHFVPENLQGKILYPLNVLKEKYPEAYSKHVKKYIGREKLLELKIPHLDCLWNDVIHLSAVDPKEVKQALVEAGMPEQFTMSFYVIDPSTLDPKYAIVYLYPDDRGVLDAKPEDFKPYNADTIGSYSHLPIATKEFYRAMYAQGKLPHMYHRVPHIFYKGSLDISDFPIITV